MNRQTYDVIERSWRETAQNKSPKTAFTESALIDKMLGLFSAGSCFYTVYSPNEMEVEYCSDSISNCLGYSLDKINTDFFRSCIHPDDLNGIVGFEKEICSFYKTLPIDKIKKYKIRYCFRLKKANGLYSRFLYQTLPFEIDSNGAVLRLIAVFTDIEHLKNDQIMHLSYIGIDGEPDILNVTSYAPQSCNSKPLKKRGKEILGLISGNLTNDQITQKSEINKADLAKSEQEENTETQARKSDFIFAFVKLTNREKQVAKMVALGKTSVQLAKELNIAKDTVKNHRKNIRRKLKITTRAEQMKLDEWLRSTSLK